jgi:hypothetical protein
MDKFFIELYKVLNSDGQQFININEMTNHLWLQLIEH